jgi:hypothetical protein
LRSGAGRADSGRDEANRGWDGRPAARWGLGRSVDRGGLLDSDTDMRMELYRAISINIDKTAAYRQLRQYLPSLAVQCNKTITIFAQPGVSRRNLKN